MDQAEKLNEETEKEIAKMNADAEIEIQKLVEQTQAESPILVYVVRWFSGCHFRPFSEPHTPPLSMTFVLHESVKTQ